MVGTRPGRGGGGGVRVLRRFAAVAFDEKPARKPRKNRPNDLENFKLGKLKQVCKYLFAGNPGLVPHLSRVLAADVADVTAEETLARVEALVRERWTTPEDVLVDAFSMRTRYATASRGRKRRDGWRTRGRRETSRDCDLFDAKLSKMNIKWPFAVHTISVRDPPFAFFG